MKRLMVVAWILGCAAMVQGRQQLPATKSGAATTVASSAVSQLEKPFTGDFDAMVKRRLIRVLTPYSKTGYFVDKGVPRGLVYDVFKKFETDLNLKLKMRNLKVFVVLIPTPVGALVRNLCEGKGDIVASTALITEQRMQQVDFTNPTWKNVAELIVTGPGGPQIGSIEELSGKTLYVAKIWAYWKDMEALSARFVRAGKPPIKLLEAPDDLLTEDLLELVNAGIVPATAAHDFVAGFWAQVFPNLKVNKAAAVKTGGEIAWAIRKGSPQLKSQLNAFIAKYPEGSAARGELLATYLKSTKFVRDSSSTQNRAKLENLKALFRKYGDKYGMDYLLMAAQGFQESQLNHAAKSPVGAIGVMQVMPATGKALNVGDISQLEPNIHAGVKFIRFMMDQYYGKEAGMTQLNKGLFTFAAYNAGPARVQQLRKLAAARGLDPNVWFNNVEAIASEKIGRETVTYVSNIYKYYIGYKLIAQQMEQQKKIKEKMKTAGIGGPTF